MSEYTLEAIRIMGILDEEGKKESHFVMPISPKRPDLVRRALRLLAKDRDWFPRLVTAIDGDMLFIRLKEKNRLQKAEALLDRAMACIDDENMYDEIFEFLYGGKNGNG